MIDLGQQWLKEWLFVWQHQAITWIGVGLSSVKSIAINLMTIPPKALQPSIPKMSLEITIPKSIQISQTPTSRDYLGTT